METLNLPTYSFNIKSEKNRSLIFDPLRRRFIVLTPEEWVRQNFVQFLIEERNYPLGRISIEQSLKYNDLQKRCDILVYSKNSVPLVLVECKAPSIALSSAVFDQAAVYNFQFRVKHLIITNGMKHYCAALDFDSRKVKFLKDIPEYSSLDPYSESKR